MPGCAHSKWALELTDPATKAFFPPAGCDVLTTAITDHCAANGLLPDTNYGPADLHKF